MNAGRAFSLARRLHSGELIYSGWCSLGAPIVAETIARSGFPAVTLDQQHGLFDMAGTLAGIASIHLAGAAPIVRVPLADFAVVSRVLDFGAEAIIAPMINTPADARTFVSSAKYPPVGERSWGPHRAMAIAGMDPADYLHQANTSTLTFAMIETRLALENLDQIAGTPGIDALFVGPSDLSLALTDGGTLDPHSSAVEKGLDRILAAAERAKKIPGIYCADADRANACAKRGFRFLAVGSDLGFLRAGTAAQIKALAR